MYILSIMANMYKQVSILNLDLCHLGRRQWKDRSDLHANPWDWRKEGGAVAEILEVVITALRAAVNRQSRGRRERRPGCLGNRERRGRAFTRPLLNAPRRVLAWASWAYLDFKFFGPNWIFFVELGHGNIGCLVPPKNQKLFKIPRHMESCSICINH